MNKLWCGLEQVGQHVWFWCVISHCDKMKVDNCLKDSTQISSYNCLLLNIIHCQTQWPNTKVSTDLLGDITLFLGISKKECKLDVVGMCVCDVKNLIDIVLIAAISSGGVHSSNSYMICNNPRSVSFII